MAILLEGDFLEKEVKSLSHFLTHKELNLPTCHFQGQLGFITGGGVVQGQGH